MSAPIFHENGNTLLISDMNPRRKVTRELLEGGEILKASIAEFNKEHTEENFFNVLELLRDSYVWIPCNAVMGENDEKRLAVMCEAAGDNPESLKGTDFVSSEEIRLIPDIMKNGEALFFPFFTCCEEMGEYGEHFSEVEKHFLEAIAMAKNNSADIAGIVINAFTEPFILDREIWDIAENIKQVSSDENVT